VAREREKERDNERESAGDVRTCLRVQVFCWFLSFCSRSLSVALSHERASFAGWQRATASSCMMQQQRARQRHTSPLHMHRAGYRHTASASVHTLSLMSLSQQCTKHIFMIYLPRYAQICIYKSYVFIQVCVCTYTRSHANTQIHAPVYT